MTENQTEYVGVTEQKRDIPEGRIRADRIDIELDQNSAPFPAGGGETHRLKLYNMPNLAQKIQLWLIVLLSSGSLLSNIGSIVSTFGLLSSQNNNCTCPPLTPWRG